MIAYDNALKVELLGVPEAVLTEHGAVSEPVARAHGGGSSTAIRCGRGHLGYRYRRTRGRHSR